MTPAEAWYVYGLLRAGTPTASAAVAMPQAGAAITPDSRVEVLTLGSIGVLASRVRRHLFDAADPAHRTADPDWMAERVAAYHAVNAAAAAAGPFLPVAFGTVFSSSGRLEDWLAPLRGTVHAALERLGGRREWQLTLHADAAALDAWLDRHDPAVRAVTEAAASAGAGTAFLMARRLDRIRAAARAAHLARRAEAVGARLAPAGTEPPRLDMARPDRPAWTVLLDDAGVADLERRLEPLAGPDEAGLSLCLTGPWPAYGFARAAIAAPLGAGGERAEHAGGERAEHAGMRLEAAHG